MRLHQPILFVGLVYTFIAGSLTAQQTEAVVPCPLAVVPARVSGLDLVGWERFPTADFGSVFRYRAVGSIAADVYIYPAKGPSDQEITAFKESLEVYRKRGDFDSFQVESEREFTVPGVQVAGRHVSVTLRRANQVQRSHFYLYPMSGQNLKVRITHAEGRFTDEVVQRFVDELVAAVAKRPSPA